MILLPAIDLYEKKAVRLLRGDYANMTVYSDDPAAVAASFYEAGAEYVHLVDLEGARTGKTPNFSIVERIAKNSGLQVEIGGGVRSADTVKKYIDAGVSRVILGTAAAENLAFVSQMVEYYGPAVAVGVDLKDGFVAVRGWTQTSKMRGEAFCGELEKIGVQTVICTDISRDGAMQGTNRALYRTLGETFSMDFIASGGVSSLEDVRALNELGLYGAIVGKALYTGAVDLKEALEAVKA